MINFHFFFIYWIVRLISTRADLSKTVKFITVKGFKTDITEEELIACIEDLIISYKNINCLKRSLIFFHFLKFYGFDAKIHFGLDMNDKNKCHSWVTTQNNIIDRDSGYLNFREIHSIC